MVYVYQTCVMNTTLVLEVGLAVLTNTTPRSTARVGGLSDVPVWGGCRM